MYDGLIFWGLEMIGHFIWQWKGPGFWYENL